MSQLVKRISSSEFFNSIRATFAQVSPEKTVPANDAVHCSASEYYVGAFL